MPAFSEAEKSCNLILQIFLLSHYAIQWYRQKSKLIHCQKIKLKHFKWNLNTWICVLIYLNWNVQVIKLDHSKWSHIQFNRCNDSESTNVSEVVDYSRETKNHRPDNDTSNQSIRKKTLNSNWLYSSEKNRWYYVSYVHLFPCPWGIIITWMRISKLLGKTWP